VCGAGGRVVYIDVENDKVEMAERLQPIARAFECEDEVKRRLLYLPDLNLPEVLRHEETSGLFVELMTKVNLLVIDSMTRVLSRFGYDENVNSDVAKFMEAFPDATAKAGIAVLLLDNTGREGEHARGAISKEALVETVYDVSGGKDVKPDKHGQLVLKLTRSRSGKVADWVTAGSGGGSFDRLTAQDGEAPRKGPQAEAIKRRKKILESMEDGEDRNVNMLKEKFEVAAGTIQSDMTALIEEGSVEATRFDDRASWWKIRR
jgi:hypothetical protein